MKLSSLIMIFAAVADARNQAVGSRWERKLGYREQKGDKKEMKAEAKQFQAMQRSMIVKGRPSGDRREARRNKIENRQNGRDERRENRVENKVERNEDKSGSRAEARQEQLQQKKEQKQEARSEKKAERTENKLEIIKGRQEARAENGPRFEAGERREARKEKVNKRQEARQERGPRPAGERRESRLEQLADKQSMKQVARMGRMKQIQLKKTWKPCVNGVVSNDDLGPRKKSHMQRCMIGKNYQNDALRCIVYGLRAEHVDKECQSVCDQILASYADLNNDIAACEDDKKN